VQAQLRNQRLVSLASSRIRKMSTGEDGNLLIDGREGQGEGCTGDGRRTKAASVARLPVTAPSRQNENTGVKSAGTMLLHARPPPEIKPLKQLTQAGAVIRRHLFSVRPGYFCAVSRLSWPPSGMQVVSAAMNRVHVSQLRLELDLWHRSPSFRAAPPRSRSRRMANLHTTGMY